MRLGIIVTCVFSLLCLLSCGLDVVYYLDYIRPGYNTDVESSIELPSSSYEGYGDNAYFTEFMIFYRIYTSNQITSEPVAETNSSLQQLINATLSTDISYFSRYTDYTSTTISTSNMENIFTNDRNYYRLALEGASITSVLGRSSLGKTLVISFPPNGMPTLTLRDVGSGNVVDSHILLRDTTLLQSSPERRYFLNHSELFTADSSSNKNDDVVTNSSARYTYICLYITAKGREYLTTIYSQPTYLGVFQLAESSNVL